MTNNVPEYPGPCMALMLIPTLCGWRVPVLARSHQGERWYDVPGGKRALDEDPFDALAREIDEEIGVKAIVDAFVCHAPHPAFHDRARYFFTARYMAGTPVNRRPQEHDDLLLLPPAVAVRCLGTRIPPLGAQYLYCSTGCPAMAALNP